MTQQPYAQPYAQPHPQPYPQSYPQQHAQSYPQSYPQQQAPSYPQQYAQSYPQHGPPILVVTPQNRSVNDVLPGLVPGLLGGLQAILWIAIIALEVASVYYDAGRGTIYAGFWCSSIFFMTWVSMFCYLCCGKTSGCAIYLLVQNSINLVFSIIFMSFAARFVNDPCLCYGALCLLPTWVVGGDINFNFGFGCNSQTLKKLPILKGLLACAVFMFLSNIGYIITHIAISIWLRNKAPSNIAPMKATYHQGTTAVDIHREQPYPSTPTYPVQHDSQSPRRYVPPQPAAQSSSTQSTSEWKKDQSLETTIEAF